MNQPFFSSLATQLPPVIARSEVSKLLGGVISPKTLANLDSLGEGPSGRRCLGRKVFYETNELLTWLDYRMKSENLPPSDN